MTGDIRSALFCSAKNECSMYSIVMCYNIGLKRLMRACKLHIFCALLSFLFGAQLTVGYLCVLHISSACAQPLRVYLAMVLVIFCMMDLIDLQVNIFSLT